MLNILIRNISHSSQWLPIKLHILRNDLHLKNSQFISILKIQIPQLMNFALRCFINTMIDMSRLWPWAKACNHHTIHLISITEILDSDSFLICYLTYKTVSRYTLQTHWIKYSWEVIRTSNLYSEPMTHNNKKTFRNLKCDYENPHRNYP